MKTTKQKYRNFLTFILLLSLSTVFAQVGINTTDPADGSILDITSSDKGIFIPRIELTNLTTMAPITGIANNPTDLANAEGLMVYNTSTTTGPGFFVWNGGNWEIVGDNNDDWKRSGNSGTTGTDFIGTTDGQPLLFKTNNSNRFEITANGRLRAYNSGSQVQPSYSWNNSTSTGMFRPDNNQLGFTTDGNERLRIDANGLIGINNNNVLSRLHIKESTNTQGPFYSEITNSNSNWSAVEAYNPKISNGAGILGTGFFGIVGQATAAAGWAGYFTYDVWMDNDFYVYNNSYLWNLDVDNDLTVYGTLTNLSDRRIKTNIQNIDGALNIINKLKPKVYDKNTELIEKNSKVEKSKLKINQNGLRNTDDKSVRKEQERKKEFGLIAQDLELVLPELVFEKGTKLKGLKGENLKAVNYIGLIPILTKAIQEQQEQIKSLEQRIESLERAIRNKK